MRRIAEKTFLDELLKLVNTIQNSGDEKQINNILLDIHNQYEKVQDKCALWKTMDDMCVGISKEYFILLEYLYAATHDEYIVTKQLNLLTDGVNSEEIDLFFAIFHKWQITSKIFLTYSSDSKYIGRRNLHKSLMNKLYQFIGVDFPFIIEPNYNRIVVISSQLIGLNHGPTRNVMDYCYTLKKKLNKEVFILITYEMPVDQNENREYVVPGIAYNYFNYIKDMDDEFVIKYQNEVFHGYQCHVNRYNKNKISSILQFVYEWKPFLVYNIGSDNLISDICCRFTMGVSIPCSYNFPISEAQFLILPRCIEEYDKEIVNYILERKQNIIESIFVYKLKEKVSIYRKVDYGFSDDAFIVAIVGTRLDYEIDKAFSEILNTILEQDENIGIVFIGTFNNFDIIKENIGYSNRVKYLGLQEDVRGVLNISDLYLNPPRKGGGTSAIEAMVEGIPLITLPNCDVNYASENQFLCTDIEDIPELVLKYKNDVNFYNVQSQKAIFQAKKVVNTEKILNEVISKILTEERKGIDVNGKSGA